MQALTLLNDQAFFECAQGLAKRILKEGGTGDDDRLAYGFRLCTARLPNDGSAKCLAGCWRKSVSSTQTGRMQAAAWTAVGRVLLNFDEFITRE